MLRRIVSSLHGRSGAAAVRPPCRGLASAGWSRSHPTEEPLARAHLPRPSRAGIENLRHLAFWVSGCLGAAALASVAVVSSFVSERLPRRQQKVESSAKVKMEGHWSFNRRDPAMWTSCATERWPRTVCCRTGVIGLLATLMYLHTPDKDIVPAPSPFQVPTVVQLALIACKKPWAARNPMCFRLLTASFRPGPRGSFATRPARAGRPCEPGRSRWKPSGVDGPARTPHWRPCPATKSLASWTPRAGIASSRCGLPGQTARCPVDRAFASAAERF
mmetsp:Transcript_21573/g.50564  ORF Transcript_21573/g.50564 Transcript_21573/m.50564 type:complete len:275 (-) Transcript_21573:1613-2437(-)